MRKTQQKRGLKGLIAKVSLHGLAVIDRRSAGARALFEWRRELERDLGGEESLSAQQKTLIELAVRTRLYLDSLDSWLMLQPSVVAKKKKSILPALSQRMTLSNELARLLIQLGLQRQAARVPSLAEYLESKGSAS